MNTKEGYGIKYLKENRKHWNLKRSSTRSHSVEVMLGTGYVPFAR
jgi:hypothetical protein